MEIASLLGVFVEVGRRSEAAEVIPRSDPSMLERVVAPSSAEERGENVVVDGNESGSNIDPEEVWC